MDSFRLGFSGKVTRIWLGLQGSIPGLWSDMLALVSLPLFSDHYSSNCPSFAFFPPGDSRERRGLLSLCK